MSYQTKTPVVMIVFNRYDNALKVFNQVKKAAPKDLFIIADGPRKQKDGEDEKCRKVRSITDEVDWPCTVHKIFSEENLGCAKRVTSGLNEVFSQVERAIIFEDDCVPDLSFFRFCDEMLERYESDRRIMLVSGNNRCPEAVPLKESYFFSKQCQIWGWATWRRAWEKMDLEMRAWNELKKSRLVESLYKKAAHRYYWNSAFDYVHDGKCNSWAFPWNLTVWREDGFSILPRVNLIRNVGFGKDSTHTKGRSIFEKLDSRELEFPLVHPEYSPDKPIQRNEEMDLLEMKSRLIDSKQMPYPLNMFASKLKWFILGIIGK